MHKFCKENKIKFTKAYICVYKNILVTAEKNVWTL